MDDGQTRAINPDAKAINGSAWLLKLPGLPSSQIFQGDNASLTQDTVGTQTGSQRALDIVGQFFITKTGDSDG